MDNWADFLGGTLQKGITRFADFEIEKRFGPKPSTTFVSDPQSGQVFQAGTNAPPPGAAPQVITAPAVTVEGKPDNKLLIIGGVAALVVLLLVLKR